MFPKKIRYAVVGLGHLAQVAVLPAFKNAKNSQLTALVSGDQKKLKELGKKYKIKNLYSYEQFNECLSSGQVDAVYIALPNDQHRYYTEKATELGVHVLCEKPMAVTSQDCEAMIRAAEEHRVKLMIAYRLHFEETNLKAIEIVNSGKIGEPRIFQSFFSVPIKDRGIRLTSPHKGGGPLYDIGIYCINASRYIFRSEPFEVSAIAVRSDKKPFREIEEAFSVTLRFSEERIASFVCSFGAAASGSYKIAGTVGTLSVENAYEYLGKKQHFLTIHEKTRTQTFKGRDHFSPQLIYFSNCILKNKQPQPSGEEGLADIRIIEAVYQSIRESRPITIKQMTLGQRPDLKQEIKSPPVAKPKLVDVESPSAEEAA